MTAGAWDSWWNAEVYDRVVRETNVYASLNQRLVEMADLGDARRVLDVGCGTGATAQACLAEMPRNSSMVGTDPARPMVELARQLVQDPRARFLVAAAERLDTVVEGPFDRIVANAAVGRFDDLARSFAAVSRLLAVRTGRFVFNLPADRLRDEPGMSHPVQASVARICESLSDVPYHPPIRRLWRAELHALLADAGLEPAEPVRWDLTLQREEMVRLLEVPAILEPMTPQLDREGRVRLVAALREAGDEDEVVVVPWLFYVADKEDT